MASQLTGASTQQGARLLPDSPCRGVCTTLYTEVCSGCGRHYLEVANWVGFTQDQKDAVWARIQADPRYRWGIKDEDQRTENARSD